MLDNDPKRGSGKLVLLDIIVHARGMNGHNILAIEVKKSTNNDDRGFDTKKLRAYRKELRFKAALFLDFQAAAPIPKVLTAEWY
jgi:hypothetical protein